MQVSRGLHIRKTDDARGSLIIIELVLLRRWRWRHGAMLQLLMMILLLLPKLHRRNAHDTCGSRRVMSMIGCRCRHHIITTSTHPWMGSCHVGKKGKWMMRTGGHCRRGRKRCRSSGSWIRLMCRWITRGNLRYGILGHHHWHHHHDLEVLCR